MDTVELNIPLISTAPGEIILVARKLRAAGFTAPMSRVVRRASTGERLLVVRATHDPRGHQDGGYTGVNGSIRWLCNELNVEPISADTDGGGARFLCKDFSDVRDKVTDPAFLSWDSLPALDGLAKV